MDCDNEVIIEDKDLLDIIYKKVTGYSISENEFFNTCNFLFNILSKWPKALDLSETTKLQVLVRKASIAKKVWSSYDDKWKKGSNSVELNSDFVAALIFVFLNCLPRNHQNSEDVYGRVLNQINASFILLDKNNDLLNSDLYSKLKEHADFVLLKEMRN